MVVTFIIYYFLYLSIVFYLVPVDVLFIVRPLFTLLLTLVFLVILKVVKNEKDKGREIVVNITFFMLSIPLFLLIGRYAVLEFHKSLLISSVASILIFSICRWGNKVVKLVALALLLLCMYEYVVPINGYTPSQSTTGFFTFGFGDDVKYYDSSNDYSGKKSISKLYDNLYWGFNKKFPIRGRVFHPKGNGKYPIVFVIHGNSLAETDSHKGYDYILSYLANNGFIGVSVDQNFLNGDWTTLGMGQPRENDVRAIHLLHTVNYIKSLNSDINSPLYGRVDLHNINLIGHSRGGEAVSIAATMSNDINKVVAIAPSYNQYKGIVNINNNPYLVLQGADDGDLRNFQGLNLFNRKQVRNKSNSKTALLISGFNHVQFNSDWGKYDGKGPGRIYFTRKDVVSSKKQRDFTKNIILEFLRNDSLLPYLESSKKNSGIKFQYIYLDSELNTLIEMGDMNTLSSITLNSLKSTYTFNTSNYCLKADWSTNNSYFEYYTKNLTQIDDLIFQFSNNGGNPKDIKLTLYPSNREIEFKIEPKIEFKHYRSGFLHKKRVDNIMFQTYKIPANNEINGLKIEFLDSNGTVYIDDIMFTSRQKTE